MLPPVDSAVLAANPKFGALYNDLCTKKLEQDGSSKLEAKAQRDRDTLKEELHRARIEAVKKDIVRSQLEDLAYRGDELPDELSELVAITAAALGGDIADEDREIVIDELEHLQDNAAPIARALAQRIEANATTLTHLISSDGSLTRSQIPKHIQSMQQDIRTSQLKLSQARLGLAREAQELHDLYRQVIEASIRILEQTIHGSVARSTKAKAEYLAVMSEGMSKKLSVRHAQILQQVYSPEIQDLLEQKSEVLQNESASLRRKAREAEEKLEQYRSAKGMQDMVKEYAEILKETERVKEEVARLEKDAR